MGSEPTDSKSTAVKIALATAAVGVVAAGGLWLWLMRTPLIVLGPGGPGGEMFDANTPEGRLFRSVVECAHKQKDLYLYIDAYVRKHGRVPPDLDALVNDHPRTMAVFACPSGGQYRVHLESYGDPNAVVIEEEPDTHRNVFRLWVQGTRPQVRTMGDGTVHVFNRPGLVTVRAKRD